MIFRRRHSHRILDLQNVSIQKIFLFLDVIPTIRRWSWRV